MAQASARMDENSLKSICEAKLNNALGWVGGRLSKDRQLAQSYYRGDLFGNEQDGRSKVVSHDVAEAIDGALPGFLKPFVSSDVVVRCSPRRPEDEKSAAQATDYLNWVFQTQPNAFDLIQTWGKSGMMNKLGVVKSWWEEKEETTLEEYEGLTRFQYNTLVSDDNVEPVSCTTRQATQPTLDPDQVSTEISDAQQEAQTAQQAPPPQPQQPGQPPQQGQPTPPAPPQPQLPTGLPQQQPDPLDDGLLYDCKIRRVNKTGYIAIMAIPPEEFLTDRRAISLQGATFCAHRSRRTASDLIEMGYPKKIIDSLPGSDDMDFNSEVVNRFADEDENPRRDADELDPAMRGVWYAECYLKVDFDGDGRAEWRKVCLAGGGGYEILENEECDGHPFSAWCPYPTPHKLYGESMADKTMDIQLIKSTVWRQTMDGMYFNNSPQLVVVEGQANMEDVLTRRPGGVIRAKSIGAVQPLPAQDVSASGFSMISYLDSVKETRTGIRRFTAGIQADALNPYASTATGASMVEDSSQDQIMLLARNFAEQGLVPLFQRMFELTCKHQDKPQTIRLRGEWVEIDPSSWNTKMDMSVAVGLGTGNRSQQITQLTGMITTIDTLIAQAQGGLDGPILTKENVYKKLSKLTEAMGFKEGEGFYTDPSTAPPAQPHQTPPDPAQQLAQAQIASVQIKAQADITRDDKKAQNDAQLAQQNAQLKASLAEQKQRHDLSLAQQKQAHQIEMERVRTEADIEINRHKAASTAVGAFAAEAGKAHIAAAFPNPTMGAPL